MTSAAVVADDATGFDWVTIDAEALDRFEPVLGSRGYGRLRATAKEASERLSGRAVWNVTSTARGGGVAEMLTSLLPLARGAGVDVRWLVVHANAPFFALTKRIHNRLHGDPGDGGDLGPREVALYEQLLGERAKKASRLVRAGDIVILHDPQTAGLAPAMRSVGAIVVWRCHVGIDVPNDLVRSAWDFMRPYLDEADAYVFTRLAYVGQGLAKEKVAVIPPSIDVFSPKNETLTDDQIAGILGAVGLVDGDVGDPSYTRMDGTRSVVTRPVDLMGGAPVPRHMPIVTQISRWDRLKDPAGVVQGFADHIARQRECHLVLAGPAVGAVSDDPEGFGVLTEMRALWEALPPPVRARVHLVSLPMDDVQENAVIVNALQRRAAVVVQKSLAEGFGLTVAEAMWKARPIVASRVGGVRDQIRDGASGLLVEPSDLAAYGRAVVRLLTDAPLAKRLGRAAHDRCREEYLGPRHLARYVTLFDALLVDG
ncbi:MAG TPA: glycosyltransferase [Polyangiaceae bacterium]|nr:glycosyltransferase [Polyangiaceae bacterium]